MKILHINTEKTWRGREHQTLDLLQGLKKRNIASHLTCQPGSPHVRALTFLASSGTETRLLVSRRVDFSVFRHSFFRLSGVKYRFMADYYIAISQKIRDVLVQDGIRAQRVFVVHSGINGDR